ncbi:MAG: RloB domain-containing protein [Acidobacteria bacterium]|nr:MAG: RloB domain-containing protein [Acidobacteriota bacterium]
MASQRRNRDRRPARRSAARNPKRRLLVVCEGKRTEPDYIRGYERHVRNTTVKIQIPDDRGEPKKVVEIAKEMKRTAEAEAKRQGDSYLDFDEVWCVFDRDDHDRFYDACTMARDNGFELAVSNPCVELWLLLHFRESPGPQHRDDLSRMLRRYLPGYDKRIDFDEVVDGVKNAANRARRLDADASEMGESGRNPTTGFYRLTDSISME